MTKALMRRTVVPLVTIIGYRPGSAGATQPVAFPTATNSPADATQPLLFASSEVASRSVSPGSTNRPILSQS